MAVDTLENHYRSVVKETVEGRVVPLLGAGVNLCGRPAELRWSREQQEWLPSGWELATFLAERFDYPSDPNVPRDLGRVSQYASVMTGLGSLYDELHELFDADYPPSHVHRFLAGLPAVLREGNAPRFQLIVTTNYDDALERAFAEAGEEYDLVTYVADVPRIHRGKFLHWAPGEEEPRVIEVPNKYEDLRLEERTVIMKIHGAVDRRVDPPEHDSYVITEDHYIDYLTRTDLINLVPAKLLAALRRSHFLFLGYSMSDWNLRVILHRIWGEQELPYTSWAIQRGPTLVEQKFWAKRGVEIHDVDLDAYVAGLRDALATPLGPGVGG